MFNLFGTKKQKPFSQMTGRELRIHEVTLESEKRALTKQVARLAKEKEKLFKRGAAEKIPEMRRMMAQEYEMKTVEQLMRSRQLNALTTEIMFVSRMKTAKQAKERPRITAKDVAVMQSLAEKQAIEAEMHGDQMKDALVTGGIDEGETCLSDAGESVMNAWKQLDVGAINEDEAVAEADRATREHVGGKAAE